MNRPTDYTWLSVQAAIEWRRKHDPERPRLTLVDPKIMLTERKQKMTKQQDQETMQTTKIYRRYANLRPMDHVSVVHNALNAVRCLAIPSGTGYQPSGAEDVFDHLGRNAFVDLLEIINDRLGMALEMDEVQ